MVGGGCLLDYSDIPSPIPTLDLNFLDLDCGMNWIWDLGIGLGLVNNILGQLEVIWGQPRVILGGCGCHREFKTS